MPLMFFLILILISPQVALAQESLIARIHEAQQSMVEIKTEFTKVLRTKSAPDGSQKQATYQRSGAGVIIDTNGTIVTNTHTIINAPFIFVILPNGEKLPAQVAYISPSQDFSFLKIDTATPLKAITWADSDKARLGDVVMGIGNSSANNQSILSGNITSLLQSKSSGSNEMIETNLRLFHGDSGDPLFDRQARLLGIIMAKRISQDRVSLAIASNKIREQYWQYRKKMP